MLVSQLVVVVMNGLPGVLGLRQLHQEVLHPKQSCVLWWPQEVLDEHPVVQLEGKGLHGVVNDHHLAQVSSEGAKVFDVVGLQVITWIRTCYLLSHTIQHLVMVVMVTVVPKHPVVNQFMVRVQSVQHPKNK